MMKIEGHMKSRCLIRLFLFAMLAAAATVSDAAPGKLEPHITEGAKASTTWSRDLRDKTAVAAAASATDGAAGPVPNYSDIPTTGGKLQCDEGYRGRFLLSGGQRFALCREHCGSRQKNRRGTPNSRGKPKSRHEHRCKNRRCGNHSRCNDNLRCNHHDTRCKIRYYSNSLCSRSCNTRCTHNYNSRRNNMGGNRNNNAGNSKKSPSKNSASMSSLSSRRNRRNSPEDRQSRKSRMRAGHKRLYQPAGRNRVLQALARKAEPIGRDLALPARAVQLALPLAPLLPATPSSGYPAWQ